METCNGYQKSKSRKFSGKEGKDMIVYGGAGFVSSLMKEGLIDEFNFFAQSCDD